MTMFLFYAAIVLKVVAAILMFHSMLSKAARKFHWTNRIPFAIASASLSLSAAMQIASIMDGPWTELLLSRDILITTLGTIYIVSYLWPWRRDRKADK